VRTKLLKVPKIRKPKMRNKHEKIEKAWYRRIRKLCKQSCESMWIMPFSDGAMEAPLMPPEQVAVVASSRANLPPDSSSA
jgi:hypothetical protein